MGLDQVERERHVSFAYAPLGPDIVYGQVRYCQMMNNCLDGDAGDTLSPKCLLETMLETGLLMMDLVIRVLRSLCTSKEAF